VAPAEWILLRPHHARENAERILMEMPGWVTASEGPGVDIAGVNTCDAEDEDSSARP